MFCPAISSRRSIARLSASDEDAPTLAASRLSVARLVRSPSLSSSTLSILAAALPAALNERVRSSTLFAILPISSVETGSFCVSRSISSCASAWAETSAGSNRSRIVPEVFSTSLASFPSVVAMPSLTANRFEKSSELKFLTAPICAAAMARRRFWLVVYISANDFSTERLVLRREFSIDLRAFSNGAAKPLCTLDAMSVVLTVTSAEILPRYPALITRSR